MRESKIFNYFQLINKQKLNQFNGFEAKFTRIVFLERIDGFQVFH
jgi:hypothetical protein